VKEKIMLVIGVSFEPLLFSLTHTENFDADILFGRPTWRLGHSAGELRTNSQLFQFSAMLNVQKIKLKKNQNGGR
jgi:hypothetical protein